MPMAKRLGQAVKVPKRGLPRGMLAARQRRRRGVPERGLQHRRSAGEAAVQAACRRQRRPGRGACADAHEHTMRAALVYTLSAVWC